jgi:hypothetical protein
MLVLLACGHEGIEKDFMTEWMPLSEEHSGRVHTYPDVGWELFLSGLSDLK